MADEHSPLAGSPTVRLVGSSPAIAALRLQIRHLATFDTIGSPHVPTVLLQGETGTGKGLVARVIHDSGPRASGPFIEVNCAAIPDTMLEAELFGFEAGAFTDAKRAKPGLFEAASGGTLFLDEIDALPLVLQGKLLTALESKRVRRLGAVTERTVDVKLIAATNAMLPEAVAAGRFRADLYHRLAVVVMALPPLRARREDVLILAQTFLQHYTAAHGVAPKRLSAGAEEWMREYDWPGNVRELSHMMECLTLLHMGAEVDAKTLTLLCQPLMASADTPKTVSMPDEPAGKRVLAPEGEAIRQALVRTGGNVAWAARLLGVSRDTVRYRMQRYGITRPRPQLPSPPVVLRTPEVDLSESPAPHEGQEGHTSAEPAETLSLPHAPREKAQPSVDTTEPRGVRNDTVIEPNVPTPASAWEQKSVAILALELTWPAAADVESRYYDLWTEQARWEEAILDKVRGFGGTLMQRMASWLVWVFGVPQGLEQLPQRAVHSALAIRQLALEASASDLHSCPTVRLAVHLGPVRVDRQATDQAAHVRAVGDTLAMPVRLLGQAEPGAIVVSPEVGRLVDGWVALEARPLRWRTDDHTRVGGYVVVGVTPGREAWVGPRRLTRSPFVGREQELMLLEALLEQVKAGRGQVVSLVGAPGMGKSRLLAEFRQRLSGSSIRYAEGRCLAYGSGMPYLPVLDLLREYCGIAADDPPETLHTKVRSSLQQASLDAEASLPDILHLLGVPDDGDSLEPLTTEARRVRTFEAVRQLFLGSIQHHPVVLVVEDLHWIDPTSEALLTSLVDALAGAAILLLTTYRPGYRAPWLDKSYATQIALHPLGPDDSRLVVQHVLHDTTFRPALEQQLLAKAEGNPLFLEELAHTVREHGEEHSSLVVPDTIQAVLSARLDRLPTDERQLLQAASAIGKDVSVFLLRVIAEPPEAVLERGLAHLQATEFLYQTQLIPEREYTFKHALTHEVTYGSLSQEPRRVLHARIVEALEGLAKERGDELVDRLAHHALRGEVWDKALAYGRQSGEKALTRSAYREAVGYFEQALSALSHLPEQRDTREQSIGLRLALAIALNALGESSRILAVLREAEALAAALSDSRRLGEISRLLAYQFYLMGAYDQAIAAAQRALALATAGGDVVLQALANLYLSTAYEAQGNYRRAIDCLQHTAASLQGAWRRERFGLVFLPSINMLTRLAWCHAELGTFVEGKAFGEEGLRIAEAVGHTGSLMLALWGIGLLAFRQGNLSDALPLLERAMDLCRQADIPLWFPRTAAALGAAYTLGGRVADAVPLLTQAMEKSMATERVDFQVFCRLALSEAQLLGGHLEEAHSLAERALDLAREHQEQGHEAYALRLLGDVAARREPPDRDQAETFYRQALTMADELGMRPLVAHCHRGLGTLHRQMGQFAEARAALSAALDLYRAMEMTFWMPEIEAALAPGG